MSSRRNIRLSDACLENIESIQKEHGLKSITAAIEWAVSRAIPQAEIGNDIRLLKKYANELRRDNYLVIDLLNALALERDLVLVPPHHIASMRSPAMQTALENRKEFLDEIMTKIKNGNSVVENLNE